MLNKRVRDKKKMMMTNQKKKEKKKTTTTATTRAARRPTRSIATESLGEYASAQCCHSLIDPCPSESTPEDSRSLLKLLFYGAYRGTDGRPANSRDSKKTKMLERKKKKKKKK